MCVCVDLYGMHTIVLDQSLHCLFIFAAALRPTLNLDLTGPYDMLSGSLRGVSSDKCVLHGRHYYDPPEMTTVLTEHHDGGSIKAGFHIGYFRSVKSEYLQAHG